MSKAEVSKILIIKSPQHFFKVIKDFNIDYIKLVPFMDRVDLFLNGCPCDAETHWEQSLIEYKNISKIDLTEVKSVIGCTSIHFFIEEDKIFEK
jgi:hypothetical protein